MRTIRDLHKPPQIEGTIEAIVVRGSPREAARTAALPDGVGDTVNPVSPLEPSPPSLNWGGWQ